MVGRYKLRINITKDPVEDSLLTALAYDVEQQAREDFEDHAGLPGARPIAAAQLSQPALKDATQQYKQTAPPAVTPEQQVKLEQVRGIPAELS